MNAGDALAKAGNQQLASTRVCSDEAVTIGAALSDGDTLVVLPTLPDASQDVGDEPDFELTKEAVPVFTEPLRDIVDETHLPGFLMEPVHPDLQTQVFAVLAALKET